MALVAYSDNSDLDTDSEEEECVEKNGKEISGKTLNLAVHQSPLVDSSSSLSVPPPATTSVTASSDKRVVGGVDSIEDEDDPIFGEQQPSSSGLFASIPAARPLGDPVAGTHRLEDEDEVTDVPTVDTWKVTSELKGGADKNEVMEQPEKSNPHTTKKKDRRKVQFFVPALSEFAEEEEEEEEQKAPEPRKMAPSALGTGLFSLLPAPKNVTVKAPKRSLVPHVLTKKPTYPPPKRLHPQSAPKVAPVPREEEEEEEEEEEVGTATNDFFSLSRPSPDFTLNQEPLAVVANGVAGLEEEKSSEIIPPHNQKEADASAIRWQGPEPYHEPLVQTESAWEAPWQDTTRDTMDEEALRRLMGKRGKRKKEDIQFIEVSADDALLDRQEWMTKTLTEEKPMHSFSKKREGLPTQKQKQKHQITYLAHQAQERELELKNNWAQNRMNKTQTQAKYGF